MSGFIYVLNCCYEKNSIQKKLEEEYWDLILSSFKKKAENDGAEIYIAKPGLDKIPESFPPILALPSALCNFISSSLAMSTSELKINERDAIIFTPLDFLDEVKSRILIYNDKTILIKEDTTWNDVIGKEESLCILAGFISPIFISPSSYRDLIDTSIFSNPLFDGVIRIFGSSCPVLFLKKEVERLKEISCGKCVYCRIGLKQIAVIISSISHAEASLEEIENILYISEAMRAVSGCEYGRTAGAFISSYITHFKSEFETHIRRKKCSYLECPGYITYHILPDICSGCGKCQEECSENAIIGDEGEIHIIQKDFCTKCGKCFTLCPSHAITKAGVLKPKTPKFPIPVGTWKK